jgi:hypothetical protein
MPRYGAIYIAHNPNDGENVFKVGLTTRSIKERMNELTGDTSNLGNYQEVGHVVVDDVDVAESTCHARLSALRVQKNREFFQGELKRIVNTVRESCEPHAISENLPEIEKPEAVDDLDHLFDETLKNKEKIVSIDAENASQTFTAFEKAVLMLTSECSVLTGKLEDKKDQLEVEIFPLIDQQEVINQESYHQVVCRVTLRAPLAMPIKPPDHKDRVWEIIRFRELSPRLSFGRREELISADNGTYASLEIGVSNFGSLEFTIMGRTLRIDRSSDKGAVFSKYPAEGNLYEYGPLYGKRHDAPIDKIKDRFKTYDHIFLTDLMEAMRIFIQLVALNINVQPEFIIRACYSFFGTEYSESGDIAFQTRYSFWENKLDCKLDLSPLEPYRSG